MQSTTLYRINVHEKRVKLHRARNKYSRLIVFFVYVRLRISLVSHRNQGYQNDISICFSKSTLLISIIEKIIINFVEINIQLYNAAL